MNYLWAAARINKASILKDLGKERVPVELMGFSARAFATASHTEAVLNMNIHSFTKRIFSTRTLCCTLSSSALTGAALCVFLSPDMKAASPNGGGSVYTQPQTVLPPVVNPVVANDELLQRIRKSAGQVFADLKNFVCREDIERFKGNAKDPNGRKLDVITSTVAYYADGEHYSDIYRNNKPLFRISGLQGAWSEGDYGTMLGETVEALESAQVRFISNTQLEGVPAVVYAFSFTSSDTPWSMRVSGRTHLLPFKGQVWASPTTGDILRIDRIADDVPQATGISGVNWSVTFGPAQVDGKSYWLPSKGIYSVSYLDGGRHEWNLIAFSGYRRYGADVTIRFQ